MSAVGRLVGHVDVDVAGGGRGGRGIVELGFGRDVDHRHRAFGGVVGVAYIRGNFRGIDGRIGAEALGGGLAAAAAPRAAARLRLVARGVLVVLARHLRFLGEQGIAVGLGYLVVVGMDFREGEESVAVAAVVDEGRLQRRLDARHLGEIDVSGELSLVQRLEIELFNLVSIHHHDAGFFRVGGVDQHFLCHGVFRNRPCAGPSGGPAPHTVALLGGDPRGP